MQELRINLENTPYIDYPINACIGYFDGLHIGHQRLVERVVQLSKENGAIPALITFDPDPWAVLKGLRNIPHLSSMEDRKQLATQLGIELWIVLAFDETMANLSIQSFHEKILNPLHLQTLVCGYDFHYAQKGQGNTETLQAQSQFAVEVIEEVSSGKEKISSTRIEQCLLKGEIQEANSYLSRPYCLRGNVVHGKRLGHEMGFPTANLAVHETYIYPRIGVYVGSVEIHHKRYMAMINIGNNPTFNYRQDVSVEAHILDFNEDIYNQNVIFYFHDYIRDEKTFANMAALSEELKLNLAYVRTYFKSRKELLVCV